MINFKKGQRPRFKMKLTAHAEFRLKQRFGIKKLGKLWCDDVEKITELQGQLVLYRIKGKEIYFIRNRASLNVVTFLTKEIVDGKNYEI